MGPSAARTGFYISLNQCSLSSGLVHRLVSVIVSRQMNPTPACPRPPEPPVQDAGPVVTADTFFGAVSMASHHAAAVPPHPRACSRNRPPPLHGA